jgi:hypothetical protein
MCGGRERGGGNCLLCVVGMGTLMTDDQPEPLYLSMCVRGERERERVTKQASV